MDRLVFTHINTESFSAIPTSSFLPIIFVVSGCYLWPGQFKKYMEYNMFQKTVKTAAAFV